MSKMTEISSLPEEVLLHIFSFLPSSSLISVWRTSRQWRDLSSSKLAASIQSSWADTSWTGIYYPSVAEVRCAAALAATGQLTSVLNMKLRNLELPSIEDMPSLARVIISGVGLWNVTGDIGPLVSRLTCTWLRISNTDLDQAATSSLVHGLQHGVAELKLDGKVRLHIQTLLEYDGRGQCDEVECSGHAWYTYKEEMKTWADRVGWSVEEENCYIVMRYYDDDSDD